jgi:hypothetical protein
MRGSLLPRTPMPGLALSRTPVPITMAHDGFQVMGAAASGTWLACAAYSMCTYKPHRIVHNLIGTTQACTAIPVILSCTQLLAQAAHDGGQLDDVTSRRISLGVAAAGLWSIITVIWSPFFTSAMVRTVDPVRYPLSLAIVATAVFGSLAVKCIDFWRRSVDTPTPSRAAAGVLASLWSIGSAPDESDADGALALCFAAFSAIAIFSPFPIATLPSLLGKRLARAFGAWTWLCAVCFFSLRSARGAQAALLRRGVRQMAGLHCVLLATRLALESGQVYPAALACLPATVASALVYVAVLLRRGE